jgi:tetratricopeptide (TPR) repeat protein
VAPVASIDVPYTDAELDALVAPYRALLDGRAALETLGLAEIARARATLEPLLVHHADMPSVHVGLANAYAMQFESTRADPTPDEDALRLATRHAHEACSLAPQFGEAWATLGFVLERTGARVDALAALRRAVTLEPDNWRHQFRLSLCSWEEERLRAARKTLALLPECPLARWLVATLYVARDALAEAEREVDAGLAVMPAPGNRSAPGKFSAVALFWLKGLLCLSRGADEDALAAFEQELALEPMGQLYARECTAHTWYAIGACRLRRGEDGAARHAFEQAIARVSSHAMARVGLVLLSREPVARASDSLPASVDAAVARAALLVSCGDVAGAARLVEAALASAPRGNAGWLIPIEPLLQVHNARAAWASVLGALAMRAA